MEGQTGFQPVSSGFKDTSDDAFTPQTSTGFRNDNEITQTGFQPEGHGFQNYKGSDSTQTGTGAYSTGFKDTSSNDPFKPQPSTGFRNESESQNKGFQPDGHGFQNYKGDSAYSTGFQHSEEISVKSADLKELSAATKEAQQALQKVYTILGKLGFHPDGQL